MYNQVVLQITQNTYLILNNMAKDKLTLTGQSYNNEVSISIEEDSTIGEVLDAFKVITMGLTFSSEQFNQAIIDLAQEIEENGKANIN